VGASIGELSGYLAGFSGQRVAERTPMYEQMERWMKQYGNWAVLLLAFVPNPFFDMAGLIAGVLRMNFLKFWLWCLFGKILKMILFSYGGAGILNFFAPMN